MRFTRFPRLSPYVATPRKLACARRAIQSSHEECPLFTVLTDQRSPVQRMTDNERHARVHWQNLRFTQAETWREARRELATLRPSQRAGLLRYWQQCDLPGSAVYFLGCICAIKRRRVCFWHELAGLRRLRLIGAGRLPRPAAWTKFQPVNQ